MEFKELEAHEMGVMMAHRLSINACYKKSLQITSFDCVSELTVEFSDSLLCYTMVA